MKTPRRALVLLLLLPLAACFEPPVREAVVLLFDARGGVEVRVDTELERESGYEKNPKARQRIAEAREGTLCGDDAWTRQLARLSPTLLQRTLTERDGELRGVARAARFDDPRPVERLFEGAPLSTALSRAGETLQLEILPGTASRATAGERRDVADALARFSGAGARYLATLVELWGWLDANPEREHDVVAELLGAGGRYEPPDEREALLVKDVEDAMTGVFAFLRLEEGRGESLEELSRKVFDPFPAPLAVEVTGRVEEFAGFARDGERRFTVPPVSLQGALAALSGRWVRPDPVAAVAAAVARGEEPNADVSAFLADGRAAQRPPGAAELRAALEKALAPRPVYRLRWVLPKG